ncbi:MAG: TetR/AcrR family transcriptional regulator [Microthrixaceae bacterium]|nr:TetR/AcrR family transcriptional regulator [Microthrixaceae bacterium]MCO5314510.1 TetR/AcrR family transcriptional regulator [Microthrixaceae bacterium]
MTEGRATPRQRATTRRKPGRPKGPSSDPAQRLDSLLDGAEDAIRTHGPSVSMEQLAAAAGVSKATLYDNFAGKAGLSEALMDRKGAALLETFSATLADGFTPEQFVRRGITIFVEHVATDPEIYRFIVNSTEIGEAVVDDIAAPITAILNALLDPGDAHDADAHNADAHDSDASLAAFLANTALGAILGSTDWWSRSKSPSVERFSSALADFVWAGLIGAGLPPSDEQLDVAAVAAAIAAAEPRR